MRKLHGIYESPEHTDATTTGGEVASYFAEKRNKLKKEDSASSLYKSNEFKMGHNGATMNLVIDGHQIHIQISGGKIWGLISDDEGLPVWGKAWEFETYLPSSALRGVTIPAHVKDILTKEAHKQVETYIRRFAYLKKDDKSKSESRGDEKWIIKDWAGNLPFGSRHFASFEDADEFLTHFIEKKYPKTKDDEKEFSTERGEYEVVPYEEPRETRYLDPKDPRNGRKALGEAPDEKKPVEHDVTIKMTLKEAAEALGYKDWAKTNDYLDADSYDDVYHNGYTAKDVIQGKYDVRGMDDVEKIFPEAVAMGLEQGERDGYASAIGKARRDAIVDALEKIQVVGEYQSGDGEMISVKGGAGIESASVDTPKNEVTIVVHNPEHLINDIVNGVGRFAPELDPYEKASDEEIKSGLMSCLGDYFEVYGDRKPDGELDSRFTPDIDDETVKQEVELRISEMSIDDIAEAVISAVDGGRIDDDKEAIKLAAKFSKEPDKAIGAAVAKLHKEHSSKLGKRADDAEKVESVSRCGQKKNSRQVSETVEGLRNAAKKLEAIYIKYKKPADSTMEAESKKGITHADVQKAMELVKGKIGHLKARGGPIEHQLAHSLKIYKDRGEYDGTLSSALDCLNSAAYEIEEDEMNNPSGHSESVNEDDDSNKAIVDDLVKAFGEEHREEIADSLEIPGGRFEQWTNKTGKFEADGVEYNFFTSDDVADKVPLKIVEQDIAGQPELFSPDFIARHIYIRPIDRRMIAVDDAAARAEDYRYDVNKENFDEVFDQIEIGKEKYEELKDKMESADEDEADEIKEQIEKLALESIEEWESDYADDIEERLKDPIEYFVKNQGIYTVEELFKQSFIRIDAREAAKDAIDTDGRDHFISHYNGSSDETPGGIVYIRE